MEGVHQLKHDVSGLRVFVHQFSLLGISIRDEKIIQNFGPKT